MSFFVLGVNHKNCPVEVREKLHFKEHELPELLVRFRNACGASELVILSTCNRVEIYGEVEAGSFSETALTGALSRAHGIPEDQYACYLYRHTGREAVRHLFRVAAGLDSMVIGENEILGQLREAFRFANEAGGVHSLLYRLMEKALQIGKSVRTQTKINEGAVSIPSVAVELAEKIFGRLSHHKVMVFGTGEMSGITLKNLKEAGAQIFSIVSRNEARGKLLAGESGAEWIPFTENWDSALKKADIVIASTSAPHPILHLDQVRHAMQNRRGRPLFIIDIAVPRNVEPSVDSIEEVYLYNIDDLQGVADSNLKMRAREIHAAEAMVDQAVLNFQSWLEQLKARPVMESFEQFLEEILERELGRLAKHSPVDEAAKEETKQRIRAKLLHPPLEKIKQASQNGGVTRYLEALHSLFDLKNK